MPVNANGVSQPGPGIQYNFEVQYSCTPLTSRPSLALLPDFQTSRRAQYRIDDPAARTPRAFISTYTVFLQMYIYAHPFSPGLA